MWNINPKKMCRKHLLGEHVEMHMFVGSLKKKRSIEGHINKGQIEIHNIKKRHDNLVKEMINRGYKHNSPLKFYSKNKKGKVNVKKNLEELKKRCKECKNLMKND